MAIYDKSLEYISGGSNVPDIKEFFWKWRCSHYPNNNENNLARRFAAFARANAKTMANLGIFGGTVAEEMDELSQLGDSGVRTREINGPVSGFGGRAGVQFGAVSGVRGEMAKSAAMPAAPMAAAAMPPMAMADKTGKPAQGELNEAPAAPLVQPTVRTKFADTALWVGALTTEKDGTAEVSLDMPENLTTWRIKVWGMGHGTKVGQGFADVVTRKDLSSAWKPPDSSSKPTRSSSRRWCIIISRRKRTLP